MNLMMGTNNYLNFHRSRSSFLFLRLFVFFVQVWAISASFNFFMPRQEVQKLHGLPSEIYYVREGVLNEYALNFIVTVPPEISHLHFAWEATSKRTVHYEMIIEFTDFFAMLQPSSNISNVGRVPQNKENFRISLPCSGRINSEVALNIKFIFSVRFQKPNITTVNLKRNKVCLEKEYPLKEVGSRKNTVAGVYEEKEELKLEGMQRNSSSKNSILLFQEPTPSLLLAGLLGGCAITASLVFLGFFIFLRRKLVSRSNSPPPPKLGHGGSDLENDMDSPSHNSSPQCLLRQSQIILANGGKWETQNGSSEKKKSPLTCTTTTTNSSTATNQNPASAILSRSASRNSYVTIASFWNDIFSNNRNSHLNPDQLRKMQHPPLNSTFSNQYQHQSPNQSTKRTSDVSPYAYAHIISTKPPPPNLPSPPPPPHPNNSSSIITPPLIEWYSQFPSHNNSLDLEQPNTARNGKQPLMGHIYANNLYSFGGGSSNNSPKHYNYKFNPFSSPSNVSNGSFNETNHVINGEKNAADTLRSHSESVVQINGFECRKNLIQANVVERFL